MRRDPIVPPRLATLIVLCGLPVVSLNMFLPSLADIAADFEAPYAVVALSVAGYAVMTAVLELVMGPLSDRFGRRPIILCGLAIFCLASLGCILATNVAGFLAFRMMQAAVISGYTVSLAVVRDCAGAREAASLMGYIAMAYAVGPMLAPLCGGALDELFGWRASFWALLGLGLAVLALCWFDLRETNRAPSRTLGQQLRSYPELLASRRFWGYALCTAFSTGAFYAFLGGAPLAATALFGVSPAKLGIYMGSITGGFVFGSFVAGRLAARRALAATMIAGRVVACGGLLLGLLLVLAEIVHEATLFGACIFVGIGNGITMPSSSSGALSVKPELAGSAAGLSGALALAAGAAMSGITGAVLTEQSAAVGLLAMMLAASALGLAAALYVARLDSRARRGLRPGG